MCFLGTSSYLMSNITPWVIFPILLVVPSTFLTIRSLGSGVTRNWSCFTTRGWMKHLVALESSNPFLRARFQLVCNRNLVLIALFRTTYKSVNLQALMRAPTSSPRENPYPLLLQPWLWWSWLYLPLSFVEATLRYQQEKGSSLLLSSRPLPWFLRFWP